MNKNAWTVQHARQCTDADWPEAIHLQTAGGGTLVRFEPQARMELARIFHDIASRRIDRLREELDLHRALLAESRRDVRKYSQSVADLELRLKEAEDEAHAHDQAASADVPPGADVSDRRPGSGPEGVRGGGPQAAEGAD